VVTESKFIILISYPASLLHLFLESPATPAACQINFVTVIFLPASLKQLLQIFRIIYFVVKVWTIVFFNTSYVDHFISSVKHLWQRRCHSAWNLGSLYCFFSCWRCILKLIFQTAWLSSAGATLVPKWECKA